MKIELVIKKKNIYYGIALLILSGYLYAIYDQRIERIFLSISLMVMLPGVMSIKISRKLNYLELFYILFLLSFFICTAVYGAIKPFVYAMAMLLVMLISRPLSNNLNIEKYTQFVFRINYLFILLFYLLSIIMIPFTFDGYEGIFATSNGFGILAGMGIVLSVNDIIKSIIRKRRINTVYIMIFLTSIIMLLASGCRSALLGVACSLIFCVAVYLLDRKVTRKKILTVLLLPISLLAILQLLWVTGKLELLLTPFINKFYVVLERKDLLNGRAEIWERIISNALLFQNGIGKIQSLGIPSHNVYLGLVDCFGIVVGLIFFIYMIMLLCKTICFAKKYKSISLRFYPATTAIYFFCISLLENYLMTYVMISMFLAIAFMETVITKQKKEQRTAVKE